MGVNLNSERLANTFAALVAIDSPSYGEREMADYLKSRLQRLGLRVEEDNAGARIGGNSGNLYGYWPGTLEQPPLLLCAHMDTVAPACGKQAVREPDGRIHSAGDTVLGADDLAAVAIILEVLEAIGESGVPHRPVEVLFSASEEAYCVGVSAFDCSKLLSREAYVLDYEGALGKAVTSAPTILDFTAEVVGKASHAGFAPEAGISAILTVSEALCSVKSGRVAEDTTVNFGKIEGGTGTNIVPERCVVRGEIRSSCHQRALDQVQQVRAAFETACSHRGASLQFVDRCFIQAYCVPEGAPTVQRYFRVCRDRGYETGTVATFGGSDNNVLLKNGITGIVIAAAMHHCHSCEECTSVQEMTAVAEVTADLLLSRD